MLSRPVAILALMVLLSAGTLACGGAPTPITTLSGEAVSGRLAIQVHGVELAERLVYEEGGQTYTLALAPGRRIAAVEATVTNPSAEASLLVIGAESATMEDRQNNRYTILDPRAQREVTPGATAPQYYTPWLWGPFSLRRGFGVRGWIFFDVPEGLQLQSFSGLYWSSLDSMSVPLVPKRR